jgi:hypothetical protein
MVGKDLSGYAADEGSFHPKSPDHHWLRLRRVVFRRRCIATEGSEASSVWYAATAGATRGSGGDWKGAMLEFERNLQY